MKRILLFILASLILTACQTTPEAELVIKKDADVLLEKAQERPEAADAPRTLREQTGAPMRIEYSDMGYDGRLKIDMKAIVVTPHVTSMPIFRVEAVDFDEETAKPFFDLLCADEKMFDDTQRLTKDEIERLILANERLKQSDDYIDDPVGQAEIDKHTEALQKEYFTAPETNKPAQVYGGFYSVPVKDPRGKVVSSYMGLSAASERVHFAVQNRNGLDAPIVYEFGGGWSALAAGSNARLDFYAFDADSEGRWGCVPKKLITDEAMLPTEAHGRLSLTPGEARALVEPLLAGLDVTVRKIYLECDLDIYNPDIETRTEETANYGYTLECARVAGGIPLAYGEDPHGGAEDKYAPSWPYERITVFITNGGIKELRWSAPIAVTDTAVESAKLLPFDEVMRVFKKMSLVIYAGYMRDSEGARFMDDMTKECGLNISEIRLEFRRVREQNSVAYGLLMPVWSFYGKQWRLIEGESEPIYNSSSAPEDCLLTINAVDGSVIDLSQGY